MTGSPGVHNRCGTGGCSDTSDTAPLSCRSDDVPGGSLFHPCPLQRAGTAGM